MVCRFVGLSVCLYDFCRSSEPCKNGWTDRDVVWDFDSGKPNEACISWGVQWRHLANTIEPSMCGSDAACCQISLTTCYTAHGRVPLYFTMGKPFLPRNCPFAWGSGPHLIRGSLGPPESQTQTTFRSVQRCLPCSRSWQTDRQTDHTIPVYNNRQHLRT